MNRLSVWLLLLFVAPASAQEASSVFIAESADGTSGVGELKEWTARGRLVLRGKTTYKIGDGDLLGLRRVGLPIPPPPVGDQLILTNGDRLPLLKNKPVKVVGETLRCQLACNDGKEVKIPFTALSVVWRVAPEGTIRAETLRRELAAAVRKNDLVVLTNGDTLEGVLEDWDETAKDKPLRIQVDKQMTTLPGGRVSAVCFSTTPVGKQQASEACVVLASGGHLTLTSCCCPDGRTVQGTTVFGEEVSIPISEVMAVGIRSGKAEYLSDKKPIRVVATPYLPGLLPSLRNDRSAADGELLLQGNCFDKGLGMTSGYTVSYAVPENCRLFQALVGLDDVTGKHGSVRIKVLLDGKEQKIGAEADLTSRSEPLNINLDLGNARELTLIVEPGRGGPVQDHVNWINARLLKK